ncbi:MAG: 2-C-methyl-D-erythritol 2,4-cyclodiphosphate synthase [Trueperaceae bacterium]
MNFRIGYGEDSHALTEGHPLVIGGVTIPNSPFGALAHSDGDVLLHALSDALLSSYALGDIGHYFPPSNEAYKDMDSKKILELVLGIIRKNLGVFQIQNLAVVITLDKLKLGKHREAIQQQVAELLSLESHNVGITFKTSEGLATEHIQARVTVLLAVDGENR